MSTHIRKFVAAAILSLFAAFAASANNLQISNVVVKGLTDNSACIQFDISWENSWRNASADDPLYFHDAVWVFFKIKPAGSIEWQHGRLDGMGTNLPGYMPGQGTPIEMVVPPDRMGVFIRRAQDGVGKVSTRKVKALWRFVDNYLTRTNKAQVKVFGVEMAYVPEGPFYVGDGMTDMGQLFEGGGGSNPFLISHGGEIVCDDAPNCLWGVSQVGATSMGGTGVIPAEFPNGYKPFYCMKYELSQGQYADFLNVLTRDQQAGRCTATIKSFYMSDAVGGSPSMPFGCSVRLALDPGGNYPRTYAVATPDRACNYLSWGDLTAYADWAGLRPITELEFEKACRGPLYPVPGEFAWGTVNIMTPSAVQGVYGDGDEYYLVGNVYINSSGGPGYPVRGGMFARLTLNAGRLELLLGDHGAFRQPWDRTVSIGDGRFFTGQHGDGA